MRRRTAVLLRKQGLTVRSVAEKVGCAPASVVRWEQAFDRQGELGLNSKPQAGGKARLTKKQLKRLARLLVAGPRTFGWPNDLWTLSRVAKVIEREFGVGYHISHVHRLLRQIGFSAQKPTRLARERDDVAVEHFRKARWPAIKKARRERRAIVLVDESGFMLQPLVRRTWAPRGQTPVQRSWDRHDRLSVISALAVSPGRRKVGLFFTILPKNVRGPDSVAFIRALRLQLGTKLLLVWDRLNVHRSAAKVLQRRGNLVIEWLPPYAPDLNPVEQVWNRAKYCTLANYIPDDIVDLHGAITSSLMMQVDEQRLLRSYFQHAKLFL